MEAYKVLDTTVSLCSFCGSKVEAEFIEKESKIYIHKNCKEHGFHDELLEDDVEYHYNKIKFDKPGTESKINTDVVNGCPDDCGLCANHKQHTCIGLIEITSKCNLSCNMCYARGTTDKNLDLDTIEKMMDFYQESENYQAEILQISGGEPTLHKDLIQILRMAREKKFKYLMLNTNGLEFLGDDLLLEEISKYRGGFEVYLQFDGFSDDVYEEHRGRNLIDEKLKIIEKLVKYKIPMTLVVSVSKHNLKQLGKIFEFSINKPYIRGINLQPIAFYESMTEERITLTRIINELVDQSSGLLSKVDFIPLPCNVERIAVSYLLKTSKGFAPVLRNYEAEEYLPMIDNTLNFNLDDIIKKDDGIVDNVLGCKCLQDIKVLKKALPKNFVLKSKKEKIKFVDNNTFRITITSFIDRYNFDIKSMQKECVHIITPDLKRVPFSAYNIKRGYSMKEEKPCQ